MQTQLDISLSLYENIRLFSFSEIQYTTNYLSYQLSFSFRPGGTAFSVRESSSKKRIDIPVIFHYPKHKENVSPNQQKGADYESGAYDH